MAADFMAADLEARVSVLESRVQQLVDTEAIRDLRFRYHEYINEAKFTEIASLFTEDGDLLFGGRDSRGVELHRGVLLANVGLHLLGPLHGGPAFLRQLGVALEILLGIDERRLIRSDLLAVLFDHEPLLGNLLVQRVDARPRRCDIGARVLKRGLVIPRRNTAL